MSEAGLFHFRWGQLLALVLLGTMLVQVLPLQPLLEAGPTTCVCEERGFCPHNPNGPCQCDHSHSSSAEAHRTDQNGLSGGSQDDNSRLAFQDCQGAQSEVLGSVFPHKWVVPPPMGIGRPIVSTHVYKSDPGSLAPQQVGDEVFHPPRLAAPASPGLEPAGLSAA